ncbi:MAG: HD domain-containing protein [Acidobacteria bacterium]|nr:HD domain-containing protein [Acidobacteriota bacterium]
MSTTDEVTGATEVVQEARRIAEAVRARGGRALAVGGFVRDQLLGRASKDLDMEVFGIAPDALPVLLATLGRVEPVGQAFPVFKLGAVDVALPRRESKTGHGHKGFTVTGDPDMPFDEAARRRDFTINAIGWDPLTDDYLDPFGGREDLSARVLRVVDRERFADDSLRVLRAVQFAARFALTLEPVSADICRRISLDDLPAERIWGEMEKLLLVAEQPSRGFALARELGVIEQILPEMVPLYTCPQDPEWHPEGDVWTHTLMVIDEARRRNADLARPELAIVMLGAVCHDLGKATTTIHVDGRIKSPGHEDAGIAPATRILDRLNINTIDGVDARKQILGIVAEHMRPGAFHKVQATITDAAFRRLAQKVDLELLTRVARADCHGRGGPFDCSAMDWFIEKARALGVERKPPAPILLGRHLLALGISPGPKMGEVLRAVYERQLDGAVTTLDEATAEGERVLRGV